MTKKILVFLCFITLTACGGGSEQPYTGKTQIIKQKIGKPYQINGQWYYPEIDDSYDEEGIASWYGPNFHGKSTATGEFYDMYGITAAHKTLPIPSFVEVTNLENNRQMIVKLNDRGPFVGDRIIDLSKGAAQKLEVIGKGTVRVRVRAVPPPVDVVLVRPDGTQVKGSVQTAYTRSAPRIDDSRETEYAAVPVQTPVQDTPIMTASTATMSPVANPPAPAVQQAYTPAPPVAPQPPRVASNNSSNGRYAIQVGSFADSNNAQRMQNKVSSIGHSFTQPSVNRDVTLHRVLIGPYASEQEANSKSADLHNMGIYDMKIVSLN